MWRLRHVARHAFSSRAPPRQGGNQGHAAPPGGCGRVCLARQRWQLSVARRPCRSRKCWTAAELGELPATCWPDWGCRPCSAPPLGGAPRRSMAAGWTEDMDEVWADTEPVSLDEEGDSVVRIDYSPGCECLGCAWGPGRRRWVWLGALHECRVESLACALPCGRRGRRSDAAEQRGQSVTEGFGRRPPCLPSQTGE